MTVVHVLPSLDSSIRSDDTFASPLIEKERLNSPVTSWFCVGPFEKLSERSEAVKNYLIQKGVDESRIIALWFGESQSIESNDTNEGRQKNRRVEIKVMGYMDQ